MSTITFQAEISEADFPIFEVLFSKFKIKPLILERKEDDTKMSKEDFLAMVDQSRDRKEVKISRKEMRQRLLK
ncbi:hypothetical protein [Capnocytophaga granulosa]